MYRLLFLCYFLNGLMPVESMKKGLSSVLNKCFVSEFEHLKLLRFF